MSLLRLFGDYGTARAGATAGIEYFWNRQWSVNYRAAIATLVKIVDLSSEDLSAFYIKGTLKSGYVKLKITQDNVSKYLKFSGEFKKAVDMTEFKAGLVTLMLTIKSSNKIKILIGWRR